MSGLVSACPGVTRLAGAASRPESGPQTELLDRRFGPVRLAERAPPLDALAIRCEFLFTERFIDSLRPVRQPRHWLRREELWDWLWLGQPAVQRAPAKDVAHATFLRRLQHEVLMVWHPSVGEDRARVLVPTFGETLSNASQSSKSSDLQSILRRPLPQFSD